jgi:hypothetical protein
LAVEYAIHGLGEIFEYGNMFGHNQVDADGSNHWVFDAKVTNQHWLKLKVSDLMAASKLDKRLLAGSRATPNKTITAQWIGGVQSLSDL